MDLMSYSEYVDFVQLNYYHKIYQRGRMTPFLEDKIYDWLDQYLTLINQRDESNVRNKDS